MDFRGDLFEEIGGFWARKFGTNFRAGRNGRWPFLLRVPGLGCPGTFRNRVKLGFYSVSREEIRAKIGGFLPTLNTLFTGFPKKSQ